jgi:hypothetical protein
MQVGVLFLSHKLRPFAIHFYPEAFIGQSAQLPGPLVVFLNFSSNETFGF